MKRKNNVKASEPTRFEPTEDDIRAYAYHLYEQRGRDPGHDLDDWLEARAYLQSLSKPHRSHSRLQGQVTRPYPELIAPASDEARHMGS